MWVYHTAANRLRTVQIQRIEDEAQNVKTFFFRDGVCSRAQPGQFLMVWIPGVDEIPMSLSGTYANGLSSFTAAKVGEATQALHKKKVGDSIGVRGPFGTPFTLSTGKVLIVGGGTGLAPLVFLAERLVKTTEKLTFILGAERKEKLLFLERVKRVLSAIKGKTIVTTEDGSYGLKGTVLDPLRDLLEKERYNMIYTCGPEPMMHKVFLLAESYGVPVQASLERLMRCAVGLCGSCVVGKYMVCRDGPVFDERKLREMKGEFGSFKRDLDGRRISL